MGVRVRRADETRDPFDPVIHPWWPRATCRTCGRANVPIFRESGRLICHRPSLESGAVCDDPNTYFTEYDAWEKREEPAS